MRIFSDHNGLESEIKKYNQRISKHLEIKQKTSKQLNHQKISLQVKLKRNIELNKNEKTTQKKQHQKTWDTTKAVPRGKVIALNAYISKEKSSQIIILNSFLVFKKLEKQEKINPK